MATRPARGATTTPTNSTKTPTSVADRVVEASRRRAVAPARVALAWLLSRPGVTAPINGTSRLEHLDDAVAALDLSLSTEEYRLREESHRPHPVRGHV